MKCKYCGSERKNKKSLAQHEIRCKENPNRLKPPVQVYPKGRKGTNQFIKAKEENRKIEVSAETKKNMSSAAFGKKHSEKTKKKLSEIAKERGFGGVTQSRWITYNGKRLGSSYELKVAKSLDENNIRWDTCKRFKYVDPTGKHRTYTPDFYLNDYDIYLDPKNDFLINEINPALGFNDLEKIKLVSEQNNIKIVVLNKDQLSWKNINMLM